MSNALKAGQLIGKRYRAIAMLGEGGFGEVWKAEDEMLGRMVALKVISSEKLERSSPEQQQQFIERFKREARTLASLKHIHILPIFDHGETNEARYLVIPFHEGGTLEERLKRTPLTLAEADRYFSQLAQALDYAHSQKIIHRDLKPSNVLLDENDNVLLADFGISKLLEDSAARLTQTGTAIGTPDYMSPEQFKGITLDDGRSDVYSLGVMLFEMAVGHPPFIADNKWTLAQKHIADAPPIPSSLNPILTPEIDTVILKALAKDPNDRFRTSAEFLSAWKIAIGQPELGYSLAPTNVRMTAMNTAVFKPSTSDVKKTAPKNVSSPTAGVVTGLLVGATVVCVLFVGGGWLIFGGQKFIVPATQPVPSATMTLTLTATAVPTATTVATRTSTPTHTPTPTPAFGGGNFGVATVIFKECRGKEGSIIFGNNPVQSLHAFQSLTFNNVTFGSYHLRLDFPGAREFNFDGDIQINVATQVIPFGDQCRN